MFVKKKKKKLTAHAFSLPGRQERFHLTNTPLVCSNSERNILEAKFSSKFSSKRCLFVPVA
jgi:hypothetical protein